MQKTEFDQITFWRGDNLELMKQTPDKWYDLAVVDPPYNNQDAIGLSDNAGVKKQAAKRVKYKLFQNTEPTPEYWKELKRISKNQIVWGGNYFGLRGGAIVWNKNGTAFGEAEIAICTTHHSVRIFEFTWNGMIQGNMKDKEIRQHPTQKPVALYEYILKNYAKPNDRIFDSHLGSGSIAIAVDKANTIDKKNLTFDGIELDVEYFEKSVLRFKNYKLQYTLF